MTDIEVSRTLVKSPPELWTELAGGVIGEAIGEVRTQTTEPDRALAWEAEGMRGTALLEPSGWGTKVTLTAEIDRIEARIARGGRWSRWRAAPPPPPSKPRHDPVEVERSLEELLDDLGSAHRKKPFTNE